MSSLPTLLPPVRPAQPGCSSFTSRGKEHLSGHPVRNRGICLLQAPRQCRKSHFCSTPRGGSTLAVRRVLGSAVDTSITKTPSLLESYRDAMAWSPVHSRSTPAGTGFLSGKGPAQLFSPWNAVTRQCGRAPGAMHGDMVNVGCVRECWVAVRSW